MRVDGEEDEFRAGIEAGGFGDHFAAVYRTDAPDSLTKLGRAGLLNLMMAASQERVIDLPVLPALAVASRHLSVLAARL